MKISKHYILISLFAFAVLDKEVQVELVSDNKSQSFAIRVLVNDVSVLRKKERIDLITIIKQWYTLN